MTPTTDERIFCVPAPAERDAAEWDVITDRLVTTLAETLGVPLVLDSRRIVGTTALSCRVMTERSWAGPLALGITATFGLQVIDGRPHVSAWVFLFSAGRRLTVRGLPESYAAFTYEPTGGWRFEGWSDDEYGEFVNWPAPRSS